MSLPAHHALKPVFYTNLTTRSFVIPTDAARSTTATKIIFHNLFLNLLLFIEYCLST
jgi:hypothetical protein